MSCTLAVPSLPWAQGVESYQWGELPREPIKTRRSSWDSLPLSALQWDSKQSRSGFLSYSDLSLSSEFSSATTSSLRPSPFYSALSFCECHIGCGWVFLFGDSFIFNLFWLCWVFVALRTSLSSCGELGLHSNCSAWASHCGGFSLQSSGSTCTGLSSCSSCG